MKRIVVSGRSGSGKSVTLSLLEDLGFCCIDNLPIALLPMLESQQHYPNELTAISIDSRNISPDITKSGEIIRFIKHPEHPWDIIYLDADDATLLKRFSETRRRHPLTSQTVTLQEAIAKEKDLLETITSIADIKIDTRDLSIKQLRDILSQRILSRPAETTSILFQSFGFKYGLPLEADYVFDVRFLPNPYWVPELKESTGLMDNVIAYLDSKPLVQELLQDLQSYLSVWLGKIEHQQRSYVNIAIGCTGGKHRSVYITEALTQYFKDTLSQHVQSRHRDLRL